MEASSGWVKRIVPCSRSIRCAARAGSSASAATPALSRMDSEVVPNAAARASALRVGTGISVNLPRTSSSSVSGTGSGWSGSTSTSRAPGQLERKERVSLRPLVDPKQGLAREGPVQPVAQEAMHAPTLSGPTGRSCTRRAPSACSEPRGCAPSTSRRASSRDTRLAASLRIANASAPDEDGSSHWMSSTATRTGSSSVRSCSASRTATERAR